MASPLPEPSPAPFTDIHAFLSHNSDDEDADTASQRSISLSSPPSSARNSIQQRFNRDSDVFSKRESHPYTVDTDYGSEIDKNSVFSHPTGVHETPGSSAAPSVYEEPKESEHRSSTTYPPPLSIDDRASIASFASGSSRKTRPESLVVPLPNGPIILGIALVDFNHLIGPHIEYSKGDIIDDEEIAKILPFLALPDGAHLSSEDYSYFHLVPAGPNPTTIFGISCNQQISSSALLVKGVDVTRSTVQKAVVVLASKPLFGPIRAKLGVVTTALFNQRDFTDNSILDDFSASLEASIRSQLTESALYMGTSLRELVHTFRQRTLVLVKALLLQKRIMFYGHPVERLCTYQYSLVSLIPGLLQTLDDSGSPPLASRAPTLSQATSLKTSDHKSMMAYLGLPLDIFGKDAFFQPYLPLQQLEILKETKSWLCGTTNSIVTHQDEIDLFINIETGTFEFRDPNLERSAGLTPADRKWMDEVITDVNEGWDENNPTQSMHRFKGSDDYLRTKFEEYISAALASVKYQAFISQGEGSGVMITGGAGGDSTSTEDFNPLWISEFKKTNAFEVWDRITDPVLFDIVEARHPCNEKPSVVSDIGLRLSEGIQELKLEQQLAPAREAVARTFATGSANFFKAVEGVKGRWTQRPSFSAESTSEPASRSSPVEVTKADLPPPEPRQAPQRTSSSGLRPFSLLVRTPSSESPTTASAPASTQPPHTSPTSPFSSVLSPSSRQSLSSWSSGIGSFLTSRAPVLSAAITRRESQDSIASGTSVSKAESERDEVPSRIVPVASRSSTRGSVPPPVIVSSQGEFQKSPTGEGISVTPNASMLGHGQTINVTSPGRRFGGPSSPTTPRPIPKATASDDLKRDGDKEGDSAAGDKNEKDNIRVNSARSSKSDYEGAYTGVAL